MRSPTFLSCFMLALLSISNVSVVAQDRLPPPSVSYVPRLGDMMTVIQLRHSKLWYAAQLKNWSLAEYELEQLKAGLKEVTRFYPDTSAPNMANADRSMALVSEAIKTKDFATFGKSFAEMTAECNGCHEAAGRAFIQVRSSAPSPSPFSNQVFEPQTK
jgi:hypothetical protein